MAESPIQSSFIPHDAAMPARRLVQRGGLYDLLMLVSIVFFIASAVLAIGVFLYVQFLQTENASKLDQLQRAKAAFEPALIQKLTRLDNRMRVAEDILAAHLAPSMILQTLEQSTLQTIAYTTFSFDAPDTQNITVKMSGIAQSVNSIALEADLFSKSSVITDPIFSGVDREGDGVHFSVRALINPSLIKYSALIAEGSGTGANQSATAATAAPVGNPSPFTQSSAPGSAPTTQ